MVSTNPAHTKMKASLQTSPQSPRQRGFTLIEILVVVAIIAVLAGLAIPVTMSVLRKGHEASTRTMVMSVAEAVASYQTDYNKLPVSAGTGEEPLKTDDSTNLTSVLLGENRDNLNPRQNKYLTAKLASNKRGGLASSGGNWSLLDDWGKPLCVIMDTDYDHLVENPDLQNQEQRIAAEATPQIPHLVAVFSPGVDGDVYTRDDIVSWRH